jgi:predicted PurR-regulated permease PerM
VVIGIALFTWLAVAFLAWRGDAWKEAAFFAAFATICLGGVDFAVRPKRAGTGVD